MVTAFILMQTERGSVNEIAEKLESLGYPVENTLPENIASSLRRKLEQLKA